MMLSQLTLRFPKKLIESLKNRAVTEKTSVNALADAVETLRTLYGDL